MKRVIITGVTGTIGTALIQELIKNDTEVLALLNPVSNRNNIIIDHELITKKYCSLDQLYLLKNEDNKKYDTFFHLAWQGANGKARDDMYIQNMNVKYSLDAVEVASRFGCDTFIGTGSQAEYGRCNEILKPETPAFPEMGYGYAKLCAGYMTRDFAHSKKIRHIWTRILSVYGPNDSEKTMIMSTIHKLLKNETPELTKGEQVWDYLYSEDAARALIALADFGVDGKTYVLGSGKTLKLRNYVEIIRDIISPNTNIEFGKIPYSPKQVMNLCADISSVSNDTGWFPKVEFSEGIKRIIKNYSCEKSEKAGE